MRLRGSLAGAFVPQRAEFSIRPSHRKFYGRFLCNMHKYRKPIKSYLTFPVGYAILKIPKERKFQNENQVP